MYSSCDSGLTLLIDSKNIDVFFSFLGFDNPLQFRRILMESSHPTGLRTFRISGTVTDCEMNFPAV